MKGSSRLKIFKYEFTLSLLNTSFLFSLIYGCACIYIYMCVCSAYQTALAKVETVLSANSFKK